MIKTFADKKTQKFYTTGRSKQFQPDVLRRARRKLEYVDMGIPNTEKRTIRPIHPGEMLREDFMPDYELTVSSLSDALCVSRQTVNELIRENRSLSPTMALRLSRLFGNSAEFWLNAQRAVDLWDAAQTAGEKIDGIKPLVVA